jgi:predicted ester cyclase
MITTSRAANREVYQRLYDAIDSRELTLINQTVDEVFQPDAVFHDGPPDAATAAEAVKGAWAMLLHAFPDIHVAVEDTITEGDKVVFRTRVTGTHQGEFRGLPPTGHKINYSEVFILRFSDGKVAEGWGIVDTFSQLRQLGAIRAT